MKQALILAAGRGARLDRPNTPKPLVDVGGQPIIVRLIKQLKKEGIKTIHISVGYEAKRIMHTLSGYFGFDAGLIFHKNEHWDKGSAYSVLAAQKHIRGHFVLAMADHVFEDELVQKMVHTIPNNGVVTALIDPRLDANNELSTATKVDHTGGKITDISCGLSKFSGIDAGLFVTSTILFDVLRNIVHHRNNAELSDGLRVLAKTECLSCVEVQKAFWFDIDSPKDVIKAEMHLRQQMRERKLTPIAIDSTTDAQTTFEYRLTTNESAQMILKRGVVRRPESTTIIPAQSASSSIFVFTDETVGKLYGDSFVAKLTSQGYDVHCIVLPDGEEAKTIANYVYLVERVLSRGVDERSVFISLGGGVVCNVCGFVASTIYRGLDLIHIPTTLMAQCDAAISHKQAINGHLGKNMVGTYYKPTMVLVDVEMLQTLDDRLIKDGFAEVIKHALGQDADLAQLLLSYNGNMRDLSFLETVIERNIALKCALVKDDPKELNEAMVLQYGHTAGHPLEHLSGYVLYHGESVAMGMVLAARVARILGACNDDLVQRHIELLEKFDLPTAIPKEICLSDFMDALRFNKRYVTEGSQMALLESTGKLWTIDNQTVIPVTDDVMKEAFMQTRSTTESLKKWRRAQEVCEMQAVGS